MFNAHKIHYFYVTRLLYNRVDIKSVSNFFGHTTIAMTERYLDITEIEIFEKSKINNPLKAFKLK